MEKESFYELERKKNAFTGFFEKGRKYSRELIYAVRKNLKRIKSEQDLIREDLPDNAEGFQEFEQKRFKLMTDCGAESAQGSQGTMYIKSFEEFDEKKFNKEFEKLKKEYKEVLDKQEEISKEQDKILNKEVAEVDYYTIKLKYFPEEIELDEMPEAIIDIITED